MVAVLVVAMSKMEVESMMMMVVTKVGYIQAGEEKVVTVAAEAAVVEAVEAVVVMELESEVKVMTMMVATEEGYIQVEEKKMVAVAALAEEIVVSMAVVVLMAKTVMAVMAMVMAMVEETAMVTKVVYTQVEAVTVATEVVMAAAEVVVKEEEEEVVVVVVVVVGQDDPGLRRQGAPSRHYPLTGNYPPSGRLGEGARERVRVLFSPFSLYLPSTLPQTPLILLYSAAGKIAARNNR